MDIDVPLGTALEVAGADVVVLLAPEERLAWVISNRIGNSAEPVTEGLNMKGAVALLVTLATGNVKVRPVHGKDG